MEWMAPKENFYALYAAIRNRNLNATKALNYFDIRECDKLKNTREFKARPERQIILDKEKLIELYLNQGLTQKEVSKIFGVSQPKVGKALKQYGIKSRNRGGK